MAQNALTVTPPNPTPPTNISCVGATPPLDELQAFADDGITQTATSGSINENIPPSGTSATPLAFAAKTAAAGSGTSEDHEGRGTENVETATVPNPSPAGQLKTFSCLGDWTNQPNAQHASSLSPAGDPTIASLDPDNVAAAAGTVELTVNGTNFTPQSVVYINGVAHATEFVDSTELTVPEATKKTTAGTLPVTVVSGGVVTTAASNWTFV